MLTEEVMLRLLLIHIKDIIYIIMALGETIQQLFVKKATFLWSTGTPVVRMEAFLFLYECGRRLENKPLLKVLKYMYQAYVTMAKRYSKSAVPGLNFMMNSLTQMYLINPVVAYQDAFRRLRAVALHVKECIQLMSMFFFLSFFSIANDCVNTLTAKHTANTTRFREHHEQKLKRNKQNALQSVYNWRFINIMRLWAKFCNLRIFVYIRWSQCFTKNLLVLTIKSKSKLHK
ncbi:hypothetical protein RFI_19822 [Reticulomyxa filosa]|uniref:Uncharacterized protein n=1 Tax=Reticulomyxa filosa TaxID=46433 RepID=X6MUK9_RETFI|nr:hypothetical protein RFI_19822 [Reticulomyxa filosa]|eukprot:ETO17499.1 hypothetical protein RFI_19822 [Reticulomyxa filosa]